MTRFKQFITLSSIAFCLILASETSGQDPKLSWKKAAAIGADLAIAEDYINAAKHYDHAYKQKDSKPINAYLAGKYYLLANDYSKAEELLMLVRNENEEESMKDAGFLFALAQKRNERYSEAAKSFKNYISEYIFDDFDDEFERVEKEVEGCVKGKKEAEYTEKVQALPKLINSTSNETNPSISNNQLIYVLVDGTAKPKESIVEFKDGKYTWKSGIDYKALKNVGNNAGNVWVNNDNTEIYFNKCADSLLSKKCNIFKMERASSEEKWSLPIKLPSYINPEGTSSVQPYVVSTEEEDILYFASNRGGGQGGYDLWYSTLDKTKSDAKYTIPTNLGIKINTPENEIAPYYSILEDKLYFSSNGHVNIGGYDIITSEGSKRSWSKAIGAPRPINSGTDDIAISLDKIGNAYIASNRKHGNKRNTLDNDILFIETTTPFVQPIDSTAILDSIARSIAIKDSITNATALALAAEKEAIANNATTLTNAATAAPASSITDYVEAAPRVKQATTSSNTTTYTIQIAAVKSLKESKFRRAANVHPLSYEENQYGHTRVQLQNLPDLISAESFLDEMKSLGFRDAFIFKIVDGVRIYSDDPDFN